MFGLRKAGGSQTNIALPECVYKTIPIFPESAIGQHSCRAETGTKDAQVPSSATTCDGSDAFLDWSKESYQCGARGKVETTLQKQWRSAMGRNTDIFGVPVAEARPKFQTIPRGFPDGAYDVRDNALDRPRSMER